MTTGEADGPTVAVLLAAGSSSRMAGADKLWADLAGAPLVAHALRMLCGLEAVDAIVVVSPQRRHEELRALAGSRALRLVEGGERRRDSVAAGLAAAPNAAWYVVHDAARPLASVDLGRRVLAGAREHGAAVPAVPVADTIKRVNGDGRVLATLERDELRAVQTPQAFEGTLLRRAHAASVEDATDDAGLVERLGEPVWLVAGEVENLKVTTPADLVLARALLTEAAARTAR